MLMLSVEPLSLASEIRFWATSGRLSAMEERGGVREMEEERVSLNGLKILPSDQIQRMAFCVCVKGGVGLDLDTNSTNLWNSSQVSKISVYNIE